MDTIFVANEAVIIKCDSLPTINLCQISDSVSTSKNCVDGLSCLNGVFITAIICATIFFVVYWICKFYNNKPKLGNHETGPSAKEKSDEKTREAIYQELKLYRSQLANFMEKQAIIKETKCVEKEEGDKEMIVKKSAHNKEIEYISREFHEDNSQKYIELLKEYINDLSTKLEKMSDAPEKKIINDD